MAGIEAIGFRDQIWRAFLLLSGRTASSGARLNLASIPMQSVGANSSPLFREIHPKTKIQFFVFQPGYTFKPSRLTVCRWQIPNTQAVKTRPSCLASLDRIRGIQ